MDSTIEVESSPFIASIGSRVLPTLPASILDEVASYLRWEEASLLSTMHARNSKIAFALAAEGRQYELPLQWKDRYALIPDGAIFFVSSLSRQRPTARMTLHQDPDSEEYTELRYARINCNYLRAAYKIAIWRGQLCCFRTLSLLCSWCGEKSYSKCLECDNFYGWLCWHCGMDFDGLCWKCFGKSPLEVVRRRKDSTGSDVVRQRLTSVVERHMTPTWHDDWWAYEHDD